MHNLHLAYLASRSLQANGQQALMITRVAALFFKKALSLEFDILARLQVLEGAMGVRSGLWSSRGRLGLRAAQTVMADAEGVVVDPQWLSQKDTGMYRLLLQQAARVLRSGNVPNVDADDLLQNALMGLTLDGEETKKLLYEVGKYLADKVRAGQESPSSVAGGLAGHFLKRKALNEIRALKREQRQLSPLGENGEDPMGNLPDQQATIPIEDLLVEVFNDQHSPLSQKIRGILRGLIESLTGERLAAMKAGLTDWLNTFEQTGSFPSYTDLAERHGIALQSARQRWIMPLFEKLERIVQSSPDIQDEIAKLHTELGGNYSRAQSRLAARYLAKKSA